ncbi:twin-arginine translocase subunit TatC [Acidianus sp. HS-5]|uniref:twin-arginine translocase subunit TatC n=1 Tax=Acidianus sp. HS-5 TaxID=2886040 RepID=UPI001F005740|nr:twin-arginine translocase subunit TatC [Acidianus sp. HS-5]BDC17281.1 twin-arginine translocase subunit TatC [Acidianus sp. HS-5]
MTERTELQKNEERPLLSHLAELASRLRKAFITLVIAFIIFFAFGYTTVSISGHIIPIIYPNLFHSFADELMLFFIHHELPPQLKLINLNPFDPLYASAYVSFYLSIFISLPIFLKEFWGFVSPGLYEHEKRVIKYTITPAILLFLAGSLFAYFIIIPLMMKFVLLYTSALGVEPTLSLRAFVSTVVSLMLVTGIAFEYPLVMAGLTYVKVVKADSWRKNWRWGVLGAFIIAWTISPGTTGGVIETVIGIILSILYFAGVGTAKIIEKRSLNKTKI